MSGVVTFILGWPFALAGFLWAFAYDLFLRGSRFYGLLTQDW